MKASPSSPTCFAKWLRKPDSPIDATLRRAADSFSAALFNSIGAKNSRLPCLRFSFGRADLFSVVRPTIHSPHFKANTCDIFEPYRNFPLMKSAAFWTSPKT